MDDLISRQAALDAMDTWDKFGCDPDGRLVRYDEHYVPYVHYEDMVNVIKNMPSADVVEVVRCKDCNHRDPEDKKCDSGHDIIWQLPRKDDWYCADGERKDV